MTTQVVPESSKSSGQRRRVNVPRPSTLGDPHREYRATRSKQLIRELAVFLLILGVVAALSSLILWQIGVLGPGKWDTMQAKAVRIEFPTHLDEFETMKRGANSPLLVAIYSESCPGCKRMRIPFLTAAARLSEHRIRFAAINVAIHEFAPLFEALNVKHIPTLLYFGVDEQQPIEYSGSSSASAIHKFVLKQSDNNSFA